MPIFVSQDVGGVPAASANNSFTPHNSPSCAALFYPATCGVKIEGSWLNSIISEIACAVDGVGISYNCDAVCNLSSAIMSTGTVSGYCGSSMSAAAAQKGSALAPGDAWLNISTMVAYYVDAERNSVAYPRQPEVFVCCKTGKIFTRCGDAYTHLPGSGDHANLRLEGICATSQAEAVSYGLQAGGMWIDTDASPHRIYVYDGSSSRVVSPQPGFFACCNSNRLWARCGDDYFDPANCQPPASTIQWSGKSWAAHGNGDRSKHAQVTFTSFVGPENDDRKFIVWAASMVDTGEDEQTITGVTIGGVAAVKAVEMHVQGYGSAYQEFDYHGPKHQTAWYASVPSGGESVDVQITTSGPAYVVAAMTRIDTASPSPLDTHAFQDGSQKTLQTDGPTFIGIFDAGCLPPDNNTNISRAYGYDGTQIAAITRLLYASSGQAQEKGDVSVALAGSGGFVLDSSWRGSPAIWQGIALSWPLT